MTSDSLSQVTQSQREYLALVSLRLSSKQIARIVGRSEKSVDVACTRALKASGERSRFVLADRIVAQDPALLQSLIQRFSLTAKTLAELRIEIPNGQAEPGGDTNDRGQVPERQWRDLPAWQKRLWAVAIAFGTLAIVALLVKAAHGVLKGTATFH